jgi:hypothetical protein
MASREEIRKEQKRMLMMLRMVKENYISIDNLITMAEAEMEEEDVAYVEKKVTQLKR